MTLAEEILRQVQSQPVTGPLVDAREGRNRVVSLARTLGGHVEDETPYATARAYRFHCAVPAGGDRNWRSILRVSVSAIGPYASHNFFLRANQEAWWATVVRTSRIGFFPEDEAVLDRLRAWYLESGLTEVDVRTQSQPDADGGTTIYRLLFLP